jgi:hypothetical protein
LIVHYELSDRNPTIGENAVFPAAEEEGGGSVDQGGAVGHDEATPNTQNSLGSTAAQGGIFVTPPNQHLENNYGGPLRFRTLNDHFNSTDEVIDYEYSGVCMLATDEPLGVDEALDEEC